MIEQTGTLTKPAGRPLTADDLFAIRMVSDPRVSPDGSSVAYVVTRLDRESDGYLAAIWLVPTTGGEPRQLTAGSARDTTPRWSPDGAEIVFVSNRPGTPGPTPKSSASDDGQPPENPGKGSPRTEDAAGKRANQLWVIRVAGGEARQLTRLPHGASAPAWSPDGRTIAFLAPTAPADDPDTGPDRGDRAAVADERVVTRLTYRADGRGFIDRYAHVWTVPAGGGEPMQLTSGDADDSDLAWSPDGTRIAFIANRTPERDRDQRSLLYDVPAAGGQVRCLTDGQFAFGSPTYAPDGTRIAVVGTDDPVAGGARNAHLWTVPAGGGSPTNHTRSWDRSFGDAGMSDLFVAGDVRPVWEGAAGPLLMLASDRGATHVQRVDLATGAVAPATSGPCRVIAFQRSSGDGLVVAVGDPTHPFELAVTGGHGTGPSPAMDGRSLTRHNAEFLAEVALSPAEELCFPSGGDGQEIHGWLLRPPGATPGGPLRPLIVQIHGGPHAMYGWAMFHEMQLMAARGYLVLYTNPRGSAGYGEGFTGSTRGRWGESDMPDVIGALDAVLARGEVDPNRVGVTGGSYGGYLTNWIVGHSDRFRAAVTQRCVSNFHSFYGTSDIGSTFGEFEFGGTPWADAELLLRHSPISYVDAIQTPLLIIHNEQDLRCPIEQAEQLFVALKRLGRDVAMVRIPGEDHNLSRTGTPSRRLARLHHLVGWFDTHL